MWPTRFEVVVDDGGFDFVEVAQRADDLHDDGASFFLWHQLVLLQVEVQVIAFAELQDSTEPEDTYRVTHRRKWENSTECQQIKVNRTCNCLWQEYNYWQWFIDLEVEGSTNTTPYSCSDSDN